MAESSLYGKVDRGTTHDLWVTVGIFGAALAACVAPTAAGPAVVAGMTVLAELNIRTPDPWDAGSDAWNDLSDQFEKAKNRMTQARGEVDKYWKDKGAEAFKTFVETHVEMALAAISQAAGDVRNMCDDMWWGLVTHLSGFLVLTAAAIAACVVAYLSGPFTPAVQWGLVAAWVTAVLALLGALLTFVQQVWTAGRDIGDAFSKLDNMFHGEADRLNTESLKLPEQDRIRIGDPHSWEKE